MERRVYKSNTPHLPPPTSLPLQQSGGGRCIAGQFSSEAFEMIDLEEGCEIHELSHGEYLKFGTSRISAWGTHWG